MAIKDERIEQLARKIDEIRERARKNGLLPDPEAPAFHESGSIHPELDDQTIAPPG